jgi:SAM-dependent MidA family methyltransferase
MQSALVPQARRHDVMTDLPDDRPLLLVANEFLDALPIRQFLKTDAGWRERMVDWSGTGFVPVPGAVLADAEVPAALRDAPPGSIVETAPAVIAAVEEIAERLMRQGGVAILIDYGHVAPGVGETLQAVSGHAFAEPFVDPGGRDLTAHVDFAAVAAAARASGMRTRGLVDQGAWLQALGIASRAAALTRAAPSRAGEIAAAADRLTSVEGMGRLFKVLALVSPTWPEPAGF